MRVTNGGPRSRRAWSRSRGSGETPALVNPHHRHSRAALTPCPTASASPSRPTRRRWPSPRGRTAAGKRLRLPPIPLSSVAAFAACARRNDIEYVPTGVQPASSACAGTIRSRGVRGGPVADDDGLLTLPRSRRSARAEVVHGHPWAASSSRCSARRRRQAREGLDHPPGGVKPSPWTARPSRGAGEAAHLLPARSATICSPPATRSKNQQPLGRAWFDEIQTAPGAALGARFDIVWATWDIRPDFRRFRRVGRGWTAQAQGSATGATSRQDVRQRSPPRVERLGARGMRRRPRDDTEIGAGGRAQHGGRRGGSLRWTWTHERRVKGFRGPRWARRRERKQVTGAGGRAGWGGFVGPRHGGQPPRPDPHPTRTAYCYEKANRQAVNLPVIFEGGQSHKKTTWHVNA